MNPSPWNDIVIGAGSAGATLAARLSESPDRRVLLLEAGPDYPDGTPAPLRHAHSAIMSGHNWDFQASVRSASLKDFATSAAMAASAPRDMLHAARTVLQSNPSAMTAQTFPYFVGKVVGGSSAVNGTLALRPSAADFDAWSALGIPEWEWEHVLPLFCAIENDLDYGNDAGDMHGDRGPIPIRRPAAESLHPLQADFRLACIAAGHAPIDDLNAGAGPGVGLLPSNFVDNRRVTSADAYLQPARTRANLSVRGGTAVSRILFDGTRAIGVEIVENGAAQRILADRVTLCAGAINTPALLQRSGVGNAAFCESLGIAPVLDLPGVGENLMDHASLMMWMTPKGMGYAEPVHQVMARLASPDAAAPDLNLFVLNDFDTGAIPMLKTLLRTPKAHALSTVLTAPASRGRVTIRGADPARPPAIELNMLSDPRDVQKLMHGIRAAWRLSRMPQMARHVESTFMWTDSIVNNDALLKGAINRFVNGAWHACGTAQMGPKERRSAVVDQRFRVHGLQGLRIVDASVLPAIPSTPTHLTCVMLAERAARWMMAAQD